MLSHTFQLIINNVLVHMQTLASGVSQILGFSGRKALALNKFLMTAS